MSTTRAFKITLQPSKKAAVHINIHSVFFLITHHKGRMLFCRVAGSLVNGALGRMARCQKGVFHEKSKKTSKDHLAKKSVQVLVRTWSGEKTADSKNRIKGSISDQFFID